MQMDFQKDPSQCGMWNADCGIKRRNSKETPRFAICIPDSYPIEFLTSKERFVKRVQLL